MRALIYARRSSESGDDFSLTTQVDAARRYAEAHGLTVAAEVSENVTGTIALAQRPEGAGVWSAVRRREVDALVVHSLDRLSRADLVDALAMLREILRTGCEIHTVSDGLIDNLNDIGLIVRSWQSSEERRKIVERLRRGKLGKGKVAWVGSGKPPYGYTKIGERRSARLVINEEQAGIIRQAAAWLLDEGLPLRAIVRRLNESGVPPPGYSSEGWNHAGLRLILRNPVLTGTVRFLRSEVHLPELAILTPAQADRVLERLAQNRARASRNRKREYLLAGHLLCACGRNMTGSSQQRGARLHVYYRCWIATEHDRPTACENRRLIRAGGVDAVAWQYVLDCAQPDRLTAWRAELATRSGGDGADRLRDRLAQIDRDIDQARRRIAGVMAQFGNDARPAVAEQRDATIDAANQLIESRQAERVTVARRLEDGAGRAAQQTAALEAVAKARRKLERATYDQKRQVLDVIDLHAQLILEEDGSRKVKVWSLIGPERVFEV